jgi:hypothetical protein
LQHVGLQLLIFGYGLSEAPSAATVDVDNGLHGTALSGKPKR